MPGSRQNQHSGSGNQARPDVTPNGVTYFDGAGIRPALLDEEARQLAVDIRNVKKTQLRRYYNGVIQLRRRLEQLAQNETGPDAREKAFERLRAEFKLFKARAHYAHARDGRMFPQRLLQFFVDHTDAVKTVRDFDAFCQHFQAVVGFHQYYGRD
jgi:CRISPR type III-A-associated protein Csm2